MPPRNPRGEFVRHDQENLALNLGQLITAQALDETIQAVPTGTGVTLQAKDVSKTTGLLNYLDETNACRNDTFVLGLGGAPNDDYLLEADLAIGFHPDVEHMVDYIAPDDARDANQVLRTIQQIF